MQKYQTANVCSVDIVYLFVACAKFDEFLFKLIHSVIFVLFVCLQFVHLALDRVHRLKRRHLGLALLTSSGRLETGAEDSDDVTTMRDAEVRLQLPMQRIAAMTSRQS